MIYEHPLSNGKGKLIKAKDHSRNREDSLDKFEEKAIIILGDEYKSFLNEVRKSKPRYFRDQLSLMEETLEIYPRESVIDAIEYCQTLDLYSFNDVKNACKFMATIKPRLSTEMTSKPKLEPISNPDVMKITIQRRDINEYSMVGGDHYE